MPVIHTQFLITNDGPPLRDVFLHVDEHGCISEISAPSSHASADYSCHVLIPGFVNAHAHLELSHMQGLIPEREDGMCGFIRNLLKLRSCASVQQQLDAMTRADAEMSENGIVAVGDISNNSLSAPVKHNSGLYYHTFVELLGFGSKRAPDIMETGAEVREHFRQMNLVATLTPHAPYSSSEALIASIIDSLLAGDPLSIHMHESEEEIEFCLHRSGSMAHLFSGLGFDYSDFSHPAEELPLLHFLRQVPDSIRVQMVHNTFTDAMTMELAMQMHSQTWWCFCPSANRYITGKLPDMSTAFRRRYPVCIGTDSLASNKSLSILEELKLIAGACPEVPFEDLIAAATIGGASFLGVEDRFGKIKPGRMPGLIMLEEVDPDNPRIHDRVKVIRLY